MDANNASDVLGPIPATNRKTPSPKQKKPKQPRIPPVAKPAQKLFEQIGHEMINKLVEDLQVPQDTPTLLDRLKDLGLISVQSTLNSNTTPKPSISTPVISASKLNVINTTKLNSTVQLRGGASSIHTDQSIPPTAISTPEPKLPKIKKSEVLPGNPKIFTLTHFSATAALTNLADQYGRVSHMGILDGSYSLFLNASKTGALIFKLKNNICVIGGDPLCPPSIFPSLLSEFQEYRRKKNWGVIFVGASDTLVDYARTQKKWTSIQFGSERVLNPVTNPILLETTKSAKRIISQNRQLVHPDKFGVRIGIYNPSVLKNPELQNQLVGIYESWRENRNERAGPKAFITVYNPFAILELMTYIYAMDRDGVPIGFAALRRIGANSGFHLDPCIASQNAPRGITDLLVYSALGLLHLSGCEYLSFGYEPLGESGMMYGLPKWLGKVVKRIHNGVYKGVGVGGKKGYFDKWRGEGGGGLWVVFPAGCPGVQDLMAVLHFVNISARGLVWDKTKNIVRRKGQVVKETGVKDGENENQGGEDGGGEKKVVEGVNNGKPAANRENKGKQEEKKLVAAEKAKARAPKKKEVKLEAINGKGKPKDNEKHVSQEALEIVEVQNAPVEAV